MEFDSEWDLVVIGAGAAGMTAALVAATQGLRVLLVEKTSQVGGTTARSGGAVWIPGNPKLGDAAAADVEEARRYLDGLSGEWSDRSLRAAFLAAGPSMVEYLEQHSHVRFDAAPDEVDYRQDVTGASLGGRALRTPAYDGRCLGRSFDRIAWPLPELMVFGRMMVTRAEIALLLRITSSWRAFVLGANLLVRYLMDRLRYQRGTRLVLGNALVARLYHSLLDRSVTCWFSAVPNELVWRNGRVEGAIVEYDGTNRAVRARCGVVLAGGGFPASEALRRRFLPTPTPQYTPATEACTGDTLKLADRVGAALEKRGEPAAWFPSSIGRRRDGSTAVFPHIVLDRAKPGLIAVNASGARFTSEAVSYHEFVRAMYRANATCRTIPAVLVCDRRFLWKYGLGMVRPHTLWLQPFLHSGYLRSGNTVAELAAAAGVDPNGLCETVERQNAFARTGVDADFGKGSDVYQRGNGDPQRRPNPCLGAIDRPPYYAVEVVPTPLATSVGLMTNADAQVVDAMGRRIDGLYACGNDMQSITGGEYPGPGAQLGPAMTFGYVAAMRIAAARTELADAPPVNAAS